MDLDASKRQVQSWPTRDGLVGVGMRDATSGCLWTTGNASGVSHGRQRRRRGSHPLNGELCDALPVHLAARDDEASLKAALDGQDVRLRDVPDTERARSCRERRLAVSRGGSWGTDSTQDGKCVSGNSTSSPERSFQSGSMDSLSWGAMESACLLEGSETGSPLRVCEDHARLGRSSLLKTKM